MKIFSLCEVETNNVVFTGNVKEISNKYYISKESIYSSEKQGIRLFGKYHVKLVDDIKKKPENVEAIPETKTEKKESAFDKEINEIIRRLKLYGNTILPRIKNGDLDKYLDALKSKGYKVKVDTYNSKTGSAIRLEGSKFNKNKYDTDYIVTLK